MSPHVQALDSATRPRGGWRGRKLLVVVHQRKDFSSHACAQLHATPTIVFLGIGISRAEIPIVTQSSSWEFKFLTREKNFSKINIPTSDS